MQSYTIVCLSGYLFVFLSVCLSVGRSVCLSACPNICFLDINECLERSGLCQYTCQNTVGSFQCLCPRGTRLDSDNFTCLRKYKLLYCDLRIHLMTPPRSFAFFPYYNAYFVVRFCQILSSVFAIWRLNLLLKTDHCRYKDLSNSRSWQMSASLQSRHWTVWMSSRLQDALGWNIMYRWMLCKYRFTKENCLLLKLYRKLRKMFGDQVTGSIPVWGSETFFWVSDKAWVANSFPLIYQAASHLHTYIQVYNEMKSVFSPLVLANLHNGSFWSCAGDLVIARCNNASWDCSRGRKQKAHPQKQSRDALSASLFPGLLRNFELKLH